MEFIVFLICAALVVIIIVQHNVNIKNKKELQELKSKMRDLDSKSYFMYDCLKNIGAVPGFEAKPDKQPQTVIEKTPETEHNARITEKPYPTKDNVLQTAEAAVPVVEKATDARINENLYPAPANIQQKVYSGTTINSVPVERVTKKPKKNIEEWLGARLFNIAASVLIFIGLILFCTLGTDQVSNSMKMTAMFAVSGGFIAVGAFISRKDKSGFPLGMLGCGFGTFFISILLSHIYFKSLNDIAAFGLILVWSAVALFMSRRLNSVMLSVTAHIGTAVSICFAYSFAFTPDKIAMITIYQFAALAVLIAGNIFCCRKTYRFGLILSQCLLVYTTIVMNISLNDGLISLSATIVLYSLQLAAVSLLSYLVAVSAESLIKDDNTLASAAIAVHIINKILWAFGTIASVYAFASSSDSLYIPALALCCMAIIHLGITLLMNRKFKFSEQLTTVSAAVISLITAGSLFTGAQNDGAPFLFIYALLLVFIFRQTKIKSFAAIAAPILAAEGAYMCIFGYGKIENVWVSIPYMAAIGVSALLLWFVHENDDKKKYLKLLKICEYVWISASIIPINVSQFSDISIPLIISEFALMNIICYFVKFGSENEPELRTVVLAESLATVYIGIMSLSFEYAESLGNNNIIKAVLVIMVGAISAIYAIRFAKAENRLLNVISDVTASVYVTSFAYGFQEHFEPFSIYANVLDCSPIFFIFTITLLCICLKYRRVTLRPLIYAGMIIDMLFMIINGYVELIQYADHNLPLHIIMTGIMLAHATIMLAAAFYVGGEPSRYISYYWVNIAFPLIAYNAFLKTPLAEHGAIIALIVLAFINTAAMAMLSRDEKNVIFRRAVTATSAVSLYITFFAITDFYYGLSTLHHVLSAVLMLASAALFFMLAKRLILSHQAWQQIFAGFTATVFVICVCSGISGGDTAAYVVSIVSMLTALVCVTVGFSAKAKGLRIYGLVVMMLCIIKLVTADIVGADSLARVLAFIIGGIICFIISGIYNKVEKKFSAASAGDERNLKNL